MAGLTDASNTRHHSAFILTAFLEQGVVTDSFYGLALDGILASQVRKESAQYLGLRRDGGEELDGGLHASDPVDWNLPLSACVPRGAPLDWHWMCSVGFPLNHDGVMLTDIVPDTHRLSVRLDARRAYQIAVKVPTTAGGASGRFRTRITPVLSSPAAAICWKVVGDAEEVFRLVSTIPAIGGRRGVGEGAVVKWEISTQNITQDEHWAFAHYDLRNLGVSRPIPQECAQRLSVAEPREGQAGIRPPLIHPSRQRTLIMPIG